MRTLEQITTEQTQVSSLRKEALVLVAKLSLLPPSRQIALALTKSEECHFWLTDARDVLTRELQTSISQQPE